jgi:hypothetical protein
MASLSPSILLKYDWRIQKFLEKYKNQEPFELNGGQKVKLVFETYKYEIIEKKKQGELQKIEFTDAVIKTKTYKLSSFKKNVEFGGKPPGAGAGVGIETREIKSINDQFDKIRSETGLKYVPIKIGTKTYQAVKCIKTKGVPKSDFSVVDEQGNEIIWISHKEGSSPRDFQQWGGMTEDRIQNHPEAQKFIKQMQEKFPNGIPSAMTVGKIINDHMLKKYAVYGVDYSEKGTLGQQNVSVVLQGTVKLFKYGKVYKFTANHHHENGEEITGGFEPVMMAMYKGDRSNFGVKGARFAIQPKDSRNVKEWIK